MKERNKMETINIQFQVPSTGQYTLDEFVAKLKDYADKLASSISKSGNSYQETYMSQAEQEALIAQLKSSNADITSGYNDWLKVGFALASEFGESGRRYFHDISSLYSRYERQECDKKYDQCLKSDNGKTNIATLFYLAEQQGVRLPHQEHSSRLNGRCLSLKRAMR